MRRAVVAPAGLCSGGQGSRKLWAESKGQEGRREERRPGHLGAHAWVQRACPCPELETQGRVPAAGKLPPRPFHRSGRCPDAGTPPAQAVWRASRSRRV